ncbi:MAG: alcohol dehydrogenase catalytic domain-containing protein [Acidimicrobiales bacterium]
MPEPTSQSHHVIVRVAAAALCRTDLHILEEIWNDLLNPQLRCTVGHENAGSVEAIGDAVTSVIARPGQPSHRRPRPRAHPEPGRPPPRVIRADLATRASSTSRRGRRSGRLGRWEPKRVPARAG